MREKLNEIKADIERAQKLPLMLAAGAVWPIVWKLWGLLESIVSQLERSSHHGGASTDRRL